MDLKTEYFERNTCTGEVIPDGSVPKHHPDCVALYLRLDVETAKDLEAQLRIAWLHKSNNNDSAPFLVGFTGNVKKFGTPT